MDFPTRSLIAALTCVVALSGCGGWTGRAPERGPIVAVLPAASDDYAKAAHAGLQRVEQELGIPVKLLEGRSETELRQALRDAADSEATLLIAAGEPSRKLLREVARDFPEQRFALIDATEVDANVAAYDLLEDQAAWLAGAAAGLLTRQNVVGYASGDAPPAWREAFAAGLAASNPQARLVMREHNDSAAEWAGAVRAAVQQQADIVYLVGDNVPYSAFSAAREAGIEVIVDRHSRELRLAPPVIAATVTDPGEAILQAGRDLHDAMWKGGALRRLGVNAPNAVGLVLARSVPREVHEQLEIHRKQLAVDSARRYRRERDAAQSPGEGGL
ncbi:MAG: BMP family ABC transporter substrate-binding protein [Pseudomonadota bacterium]